MDELYAFTVPVFVKGLGALKGMLEKAQAHLAETGKSEAEFMDARLIADMFPLVKQVQIACDTAKGAAAKLSGGEAPKMEDNEKTFAELFARIDKTVAYLNSVSAESFVGAAERQISLPYFPGKYLTGLDYAREYSVPNFFFHVTMAYALARREGVQIGKGDYLGGLPLQDL